VLALVGSALNAAFVAAEHVVLHWHYRQRATEAAW
jgi:hypothetical protein